MHNAYFMSFIPFTPQAFFPVVIYGNMLRRWRVGVNNVRGNQDMQITKAHLKSFSVYSFDLVPETYAYFTLAALHVLLY